MGMVQGGVGKTVELSGLGGPEALHAESIPVDSRCWSRYGLQDSGVLCTGDALMVWLELGWGMTGVPGGCCAGAILAG